MASSSKMPSALAILGAVKDGYVDLDEPVSTYLHYWTKDPSDRRSRVTLRHLLSFTSGFYANELGGSVNCMGRSSFEYADCVKRIYHNAPFAFEPGSTFDYNSFHLQVAGGVVIAATGLSMDEFLHKYLINRLNLQQTSYFNKTNPMLAAGLNITGNDYEKILYSYLTYDIIDKPLAAQFETDYTDPKNGVEPSNSTSFLADYIGHYGFAHWIECWNNGNDTLTPACKAQHVHSDPGLFGYYPLVDRRYGYYMQIVLQKFVTSTTNFGPTQSAAILRIVLKPLIDAIMTGRLFEPKMPFLPSVLLNGLGGIDIETLAVDAPSAML